MAYTASHIIRSDQSVSEVLTLPSFVELAVVAGCAGVIAIPNIQNIHALLGAYDAMHALSLLAMLAVGVSLILIANDRIPSIRSALLAASTAFFVWLAYLAYVNVLSSYGSYNVSRLLLVAILLSSAALLVAVPTVRQAWLNVFVRLPTTGRYGLYLLLLLGVCSAFLSTSPVHAYTEISQYVLFFVCAALVAAGVLASNESIQKLILGVLIAAAALYLLGFLASWGYHLASGRLLVWPDINLGFSNIRTFNLLQTWTLPLLILPALLLPDRYRILRWGCIGITAFWWALLLASGGRGTTLAIVVGIITVALLFRREALSWMRLQGVAFVGGAVIYGFFYRLLIDPSLFAHSTLLERSLATDSVRIPAWEHALNLTFSSPWLGVGPMHYAQLMPESVWAYPLNMVLQFASEWGLPAAIILCGLGIWAFYAWSRRARERIGAPSIKKRDVVLVGLTAAIVAGATQSMLDGVIVSPISQLWMVIVLGWAWGLYLSMADGRERRQQAIFKKRDEWFLIAVVLASTVVLLYFVAGEVPYLHESNAAYLDQADGSRLYARFWQQGYINILE